MARNTTERENLMTTMTRRLLSLLGFLLLLPASLGLAQETSRVLAHWDFDREGDLLNWSPNGQLTDVKVSGGTLHFRAAGSDPILSSPRSWA